MFCCVKVKPSFINYSDTEVIQFLDLGKVAVVAIISFLNLHNPPQHSPSKKRHRERTKGSLNILKSGLVEMKATYFQVIPTMEFFVVAQIQGEKIKRTHQSIANLLKTGRDC